MNAILTPIQALRLEPEQVAYVADDLLPEVELTMRELASLGRSDLTAEMALAQLSSPGKRVRGRLALHACSCFGVEARDAIAWAAAVEILHNATLVHDDVQDGDTMRRGRPTIWAEYGRSQAINVGDYLLMLPFLALRAVRPEFQGGLSQLVAEYSTQIVRGQVDEIELNQKKRVGRDEFLAACEGKTGALLALPVVGAAALSGMELKDALRFARPFIQLGVLFQLQDDVVDLFGAKGRGILGGDIHEGKVSALLVSLLEVQPSLGREVTAILRKPRGLTTKEDVLYFKTLYQESGALKSVLSTILHMRDQVLSSTLLRSEPRLMSVAQTLAEMALAPIEHLFEGAA